MYRSFLTATAIQTLSIWALLNNHLQNLRNSCRLKPISSKKTTTQSRQPRCPKMSSRGPFRWEVPTCVNKLKWRNRSTSRCSSAPWHRWSRHVPTCGVRTQPLLMLKKVARSETKREETCVSTGLRGRTTKESEWTRPKTSKTSSQSQAQIILHPDHTTSKNSRTPAKPKSFRQRELRYFTRTTYSRA